MATAPCRVRLQYKHGEENQQADALSRLETKSPAAHEEWDDIPAFILDVDMAASAALADEGDNCIEDNEDDLSDAYADEVFATLPPVTREDPMFTPISHEELVTAQLSDPFCTEVRLAINKGVVTPFGYNHDGLLCRQASHDQIVVPHTLKARVLHIHHYSRQAAHPGGKKMYCAMKKHFYWPAMSVDCYATVKKCTTCAKNRLTLRKGCSPLQLFPAEGPLESVAIDVFGSILKTARGYQYLLVISDRFTKLTKTVALKTMKASEISRAFVHEWVFN